MVDDDNPALTKWIWSNNVTWIQNQIDVLINPSIDD